MDNENEINPGTILILFGIIFLLPNIEPDVSEHILIWSLGASLILGIIGAGVALLEHSKDRYPLRGSQILTWSIPCMVFFSSWLTLQFAFSFVGLHFAFGSALIATGFSCYLVDLIIYAALRTLIE